MKQIGVVAKIPFLWGRKVFKKSHWSRVNLIVGPNGSGKSILAQKIASQFADSGQKVTFLDSERTDDTILGELWADKKIREKIEEVLSNMFGKSIRFEKDSNIPIVVNKSAGIEYGLKEGECHGFKRILTLLLALYGSGDGCLFIDEPELHLHPQFQLFFMNEIRREATANPNRMFFLITHSPYFIDLKFPEDLIGVVVCHINKAPTHIESLSKDDASLFMRFLPRFNTYHKQFFFSDNQIFVEGYTDQQMFSALLSCLESKYRTAGTGITDVGGKDELGVFFKVCGLLGTNARIITDLDSLFCGKLKDAICSDARPAQWLSKQAEKQAPFYRQLFTERADHISLRRLITRLEAYLAKIGSAISKLNPQADEELNLLRKKVNVFYSERENPELLDTYKTVVLQGIRRCEKKLSRVLPKKTARDIPAVINLSKLIFAAAEAARVYILPDGCIEHYYTQNKVNYMPVSAKDRLFHDERNHILSLDYNGLHAEYPVLTSILEKACAL